MGRKIPNTPGSSLAPGVRSSAATRNQRMSQKINSRALPEMTRVAGKIGGMWEQQVQLREPRSRLSNGWADGVDGYREVRAAARVAGAVDQLR